MSEGMTFSTFGNLSGEFIEEWKGRAREEVEADVQTWPADVLEGRALWCARVLHGSSSGLTFWRLAVAAASVVIDNERRRRDELFWHAAGEGEGT